MNNLFLFLFLVALFALAIGLINPKFAIRWGETRTRGRATLIYGVAAIILFIAFGITSKPVTSITPASTAQPKVQSVAQTAAVSAPVQVDQTVQSVSPVTSPAIPQPAAPPVTPTQQTPVPTANINGQTIIKDFSALGVSFTHDTIAGQPYIKGLSNGDQPGNIEIDFFDGLDNCPSIMLTLHGVDKANLLFLSMLMQDALPGYNATDLFTKSINSLDNEQSEIYGDRTIKMQYSSTGLFIASIDQNKA
jgi:hypothetical protein